MQRKVAAIAAETGASQYLAWRREIETLGVPSLVYVKSSAAAPELLMRTDSPLAVDSLFRKLGSVPPA